MLAGVVFPFFLPVLCVFKREKQPGWLGKFTPIQNQFLSGALACGNAVNSGVLATLPQASGSGLAHNQKKDYLIIGLSIASNSLKKSHPGLVLYLTLSFPKYNFALPKSCLDAPVRKLWLSPGIAEARLLRHKLRLRLWLFFREWPALVAFDAIQPLKSLKIAPLLNS